MASFNADIYLKLVTQEAERALKSFENKLDRVENRQQRLNRAASRLPGVGGTGRAGAGVGAGVQASPGRSANNLSRELRVLGQLDQQRLATNKQFRAENLKQLADAKKLRQIKSEINKVQQIKNDQLKREEKLRQKNLATAKKQKAVEEAANKRRRNRGLQSAALGVGFPLLFGGGAGSIAGGLLGSAGGFGGQIFGSAIGQQIDNAVQSIAKLGQALNPLTADVEALTKAAGLSGTQTERLIKRLEELGNAEAALDAATAQLAQLVGQQGVDALKEFGEESAELGNEISRALTVVGAAVAELINRSGLLKRLIDGIAFDTDLKRGLANRGNDAELSRLFNERGNPDLARIDANAEDVQARIRAIDEAIVLRQRELDLESAITTQRKTQAEIQAQINANNAPKVAALQAELDLKESGLDLTTQEGFQLALILKSKQLDAQTQSEIGKGVSAEVQQLRRKLALLDLVNQRKEEERRKDEEARRKAEAAERKRQAAIDKENRVKAQLNSIQASAISIQAQRTQIASGETAALQYQLGVIQEKYEFLRKAIELSKQDARVKDLLLQKLELQKKLEKDQLNSRLRALETEKAITAEKNKQALVSISTDINRQIQDANFRGTGNAAQDEQLQLRIEQTRRAEDVTRQLTAAIAEQQAIINNPANADQAMNAEEQRRALQDQLDLYNQLLPQLDAAEQAQLRYNQVLQAATPYAEAFAIGLTQGLRDVVAGTKTAEEAFADFLNNIADLLLQTAATMIATYIKIAIARAFAGMGGGSPSPMQKVNGLGGLGTGMIKPLAEGGYVTSPTPALVGEGGEGETIIPDSKMSEAMRRYSNGARGESVVPGKSGEGYAGGGSSGSTIVNYNGPTLNFNGDDYVPASAVPGIIDEAAKRGAKAGEQRTFTTLRNSRSQRSRIGI